MSSSKGEVADSTAQEVKPTVAADMSNTDTPADSHKADTAAADVPVADQQVASATGAGDAPASIAEAHSEEPAAHSEEPATAPGANGESIGKAEQEAAVAETSLADAEADGMETQEAASPEALKADKDAGATAGAGAREVSKDTTTAVANSQANGVKNEEIGKADEVSKPAEERLVKQVVGDSKQDEVMVCCQSVVVLCLLLSLTHSFPRLEHQIGVCHALFARCIAEALFFAEELTQPAILSLAVHPEYAVVVLTLSAIDLHCFTLLYLALLSTMSTWLYSSC